MKDSLLIAAFERYGVDLKNTTREQMVRCPAHDEDTASCHVNVGVGVWNCFGCGNGGDAYTLVMLREGTDFATATEILGARPTGSGRGVQRGSSGESRRGIPVRAGSARGGRWVPARLREVT